MELDAVPIHVLAYKITISSGYYCCFSSSLHQSSPSQKSLRKITIDFRKFSPSMSIFVKKLFCTMTLIDKTPSRCMLCIGLHLISCHQHRACLRRWGQEEPHLYWPALMEAWPHIRPFFTFSWSAFVLRWKFLMVWTNSLLLALCTIFFLELTFRTEQYCRFETRLNYQSLNLIWSSDKNLNFKNPFAYSTAIHVVTLILLYLIIWVCTPRIFFIYG